MLVVYTYHMYNVMGAVGEGTQSLQLMDAYVQVDDLEMTWPPPSEQIWRI